MNNFPFRRTGTEEEKLSAPRGYTFVKRLEELTPHMYIQYWNPSKPGYSGEVFLIDVNYKTGILHCNQLAEFDLDFKRVRIYKPEEA